MARLWKRFRIAPPKQAGSHRIIYQDGCNCSLAAPRAALQVDHTNTRGVCHGIGPAGGVELVEQRADVEFGGVNGYSELSRNRLVRCAFGHQHEHIAFAGCKVDVSRFDGGLRLP